MTWNFQTFQTTSPSQYSAKNICWRFKMWANGEKKLSSWWKMFRVMKIDLFLISFGNRIQWPTFVNDFISFTLIRILAPLHPIRNNHISLVPCFCWIYYIIDWYHGVSFYHSDEKLRTKISFSLWKLQNFEIQIKFHSWMTNECKFQHPIGIRSNAKRKNKRFMTKSMQTLFSVESDCKDTIQKSNKKTFFFPFGEPRFLYFVSQVDSVSERWDCCF